MIFSTGLKFTILVSMTRNRATSPTGPQSDHWMLQDAKARFSELVRRARSSGPQHVTVHGRDEVVVVSSEEFARLQGRGRTGADLVAALRAIPWPEDMVEPEGVRAPVREVDFP